MIEVYGTVARGALMKSCSEKITLDVGENNAKALGSANAGVAAVQFGNVLDQVDSQNDVKEILSTLGFELVNGYDNFTLVSSLASFIVKCETTPDTATSDYLKGHTAIVAAILGWRLLGAIISIIDERMSENDQIEAEKKKISKVIQRHGAMLAYLSKIQDKNSNNNFESKKKDKWADFNVSQLDYAFEKMQNGPISELELEQLYVVFRKALGNKATPEDFKAWEDFVENPSVDNKDALKMKIAAGLRSKVKVTPIADKDTRFTGRVLKLIGNFIMANFTGISIVIVVSGFVAAIPFFAGLGFAATLPAVFVAAIGVGLGYAFLTMYQEKKAKRHQKIARKLNQEKVRYKQNLAIEKLSSSLSGAIESNAAEILGENQNAVDIVSKDLINDSDSMKTISENEGASFTWRLLIDMPFTLSNATVSGWWAVLMGATVVTGLIGGAGLVGFSAIIAPVVAAGLSGLFALSKLIVNSYYDYHVEKERIHQVNNNLTIQRMRAQSSETLRGIVKLSKSELLKEHIDLMLKNKDLHSRKKDFHMIEKFIGAKISDAENDDAFYGYLASKLVYEKHENHVGYQKTEALNLVKNLRNFMSDKNDGGLVHYNPTFNKKSTSLKERFRSLVGYGFGITAPIAVGLGFPMAFIMGPAFLYVGIGMAAVLCATYYISSVINDRREARMKNYDAMLAQIDMRDRLADMKLSEKYLPKNPQIENAKRPSDESGKMVLANNMLESVKMTEDARTITTVVKSQATAWSLFGFLFSYHCTPKATSSPSSAVELPSRQFR